MSKSQPNSHIIHAYAEAVSASETFNLPLVEGKEKGKVLLASTGVSGRRNVDFSWLKGAAEPYCISPDIKDYVLAEVPIVEGDVPNRNMNCFLTSRLCSFVPEHGCLAFQTFIGKPTFLEHDHEDITKAKGVIFDATMREINGRFYVFILKGFDRTKDEKLANDVLRMRMRGHSMSAYTEFFDCSICGHRFNTAWANACPCHKGKPEVKNKFLGLGTVVNGKLTYNMPFKFRFFESSAVGDPANYIAWQTQQLTL